MKHNFEDYSSIAILGYLASNIKNYKMLKKLSLLNGNFDKAFSYSLRANKLTS